MFLIFEVGFVGFIEVVVWEVGIVVCVVDYDLGWVVGVSLYEDGFVG